MPRPPRCEAPGATHHVVAKAVAKDRIVRDDYDRRQLWSQLGRTVDRVGWRCLAFCFLDTHFHLLVQTPEPNLGTGMQWLCGRYAQAFNARWGRAGHLFGARYYSTPISNEHHFVAALIYVLLNPVRAGLVDRAELWPWSSYSPTVGRTVAPSFLDVEGVLERVHRDPTAARHTLAEAVEATARVRTFL